MGRKATGQVVEVDGATGRSFALRFRAYGKRRYVTLGTAAEGWTRGKAAEELANVLADVRRGIWKPDERRDQRSHRRSRPSTSSPRSGLSRVATSSPHAPPRTTNWR